VSNGLGVLNRSLLISRGADSFGGDQSLSSFFFFFCHHTHSAALELFSFELCCHPLSPVFTFCPLRFPKLKAVDCASALRRAAVAYPRPGPRSHKVFVAFGFRFLLRSTSAIWQPSSAAPVAGLWPFLKSSRVPLLFALVPAPYSPSAATRTHLFSPRQFGLAPPFTSSPMFEESFPPK